MDTTGVIQLTVLVILVALSAFFSSAETALSTVNKIRIRALAEEGNSRAATVEKILDRYSKMISAVLIGNNIVNLSASSLATTFAIKMWGSYAVGIATGILTLVILMLGEIVPKTWARCYAERISLIYAAPIYLLMWLLTPVIYIVDRFAGGILHLLHIDPNKRMDAMTENELRTYVEVSHEDGVIESEERELIYNVFDFGDALAKDIMIPRIDMTTLAIDSTYEEARAVFRESMYTRLPVYENEIDNIVGLINVKDFLLIESYDTFQPSDILRKAYYTYEFKKTTDLMLEMRKNSHSVAFVLNEYGATVGMITLEDLLEEIVGEIRDEYDADEAELLKEVGERQYLIAGGMKLDDINDAIGTSLTSEDYDSIGGIIIELLDNLPKEAEEVTTADGITLKVVELNQNRIEKVLLTLPEAEEQPEVAADAVNDLAE